MTGGPFPLPGWWVAVAVVLHLASNAQYAVAVVRRRARPDIVTWTLWGLLPMVAVAADLVGRVPLVHVDRSYAEPGRVLGAHDPTLE